MPPNGPGRLVKDMGDKRLQELARQYARDEIPVQAYRARRAELLDSLATNAVVLPPPQPGHVAEAEPPWLNWLPLGIAALALASTVFWIVA